MTQQYDFETVVNRRGTGSYKYQAMFLKNPDVAEDIIPLNTADMEIKSPPELYHGLAEYLTNEPILGYTGGTLETRQAILDWLRVHHHYEIQPEWIVFTPGVVQAIDAAISALSKPGDGVMIFQPVYYPFEMTIQANQRTKVNIPLMKNDENYYTIDFERFEAEAAKPENKILLLCSPHNPVGRVWTKEELERLSEICIKNDLSVISDEIWLDFTRNGHSHFSMGRIDQEDFQEKLVICTAITKSFNLAGLGISNIIIPNEQTRQLFEEELLRKRQNHCGAMGYEATKIVYSQCADWLCQVNDLITTNQNMVAQFFEEKYPKIKAPISEGTYVQWVDFSALGMTNDELDHFMDHTAQFFTEHGHIYGAEGSGFERINCALPTHALKAQLDKLDQALSQLDF